MKAPPDPAAPPPAAEPVLPAAVVGIGASAGGLEAIQAFFQAMPADSGMAFVVIQHLSPDHKSLMVELLSRKTAMPVCRAEEGMMVQPDHIYLIPPKKSLTIFHGRLLLQDQKPRGEVSLPVDIFLRSLAEDQGERAVGVILSGTGSDGTRGVRAVKEWGGLVLVQDGESAKFDGMPRAAASTGVADFVLPPGDMPAQLVACLRHPYATRQRRAPQALADETGLTRLFSLLRARTKVDFTYYKPSTITRRIERRIAVTQVPDLEAYVRFAEQTPAEVSTLYRELLIGVTSFFRDPAVMTVLQERVLPELFGRCTDRELRFWVAGCSTGEEAYTLAILAREVMHTLGLARDVKIFATDIDREAVLKAGTGIYPESIAADLNPALLAKYFYCHGESYQVARSLREMVVFAQHNLVKDPPFTRIDLVSCRNLLIYLQSNLQQQALALFGFSLNPGGVLVLGTSETVGELEDRFEPVDRKARIYRSLGKSPLRSAPAGLALPADADARLPLAAVGGLRLGRTGPREQERLLGRLLEGLAATYVPLAVVVNEQLEVLHTVGEPGGLFTLPSGRAVYDLPKMVHRDLAIPLATGIQKVFRTGTELVYANLRLREGAGTGGLRLRLRLLPGRKQDEPLAIVCFERLEESHPPATGATVEYNLDEETRQRLQDLEQELQFTRENLQATIEELETSNEELQATNEELLASNEELQSTNEELQSTNEELYTVNAEYHNKIIELTEVQNDVDNLLSSSRIGTLILDEDLCIRRYSPPTAAVFHLVDGDVGRPLKHLTHRLAAFDPVGIARTVQRNGEPWEEEVRADDGRWYLVRALPYRVGPGAFAGVVLTLIDITPLREVRERLERTLQSEADIVRHMPAGLFVYEVTAGGELVLQSGNAAAQKITGLDLTASRGRRFVELWPGDEGARLQAAFIEGWRSGQPVYVPELRYADPRFGGVFHVHAFPLPGERLAVGFEDITERCRSGEALRASEQFAQATLDALPDPVCVLDEAGTILAVNQAWRDLAPANGTASAARAEGGNYFEVGGTGGGAAAVEGEAAAFHAGIREVLSGGQAGFTQEYATRGGGETRWWVGHVTRFPGGGPVRAVVTTKDISVRKRAEARLAASEERHRDLYRLLADAERSARMGSWTWEVETDTVTWSENLFHLFGRDPGHGAPPFAGHAPFYTGESLTRLRKAVETALREGTGYELELEAVRSDGTHWRCVARGQPEPAEPGAVRRLFGSLQELPL